MLAEKSGVPKEFFPPMTFRGKRMDIDAARKPSKLCDIGLKENDVIDMDPMKLNVNYNGKAICLDNVDPFNDTIDDIKARLGDDGGMDILPVNKQRLMFGDVELTNHGGGDGDGSEKVVVGDGPITFTVETKTSGGKPPKTITVNCRPEDATISYIKDFIEQEIGTVHHPLINY